MKEKYFNLLKDTANYVDPYVINTFNILFSTSSELKDILIKQYRFWKPQLRPTQVRLAYELVWGTNWKQTIPACASVEIKDTWYYCYDDVLDLGKNQKLTLIWGMLITLSHVVIQDLLVNFNTIQVSKVSHELFELDKNNLEWTMLDWQLKKGINKELYMKKADKYNFREQALKIGWILWNGSQTDVDILGFIWKKIGTAYIIANDTWDFGKNLEDFRSWKYTLPMIKALEETTNTDQKTLLSLFWKNELSEEEIKIIKHIMIKSKSIDICKKTAQEFCDEWIAWLQRFDNSNTKEMLTFATTITQKNKYYDKINDNLQ